MTWYAASIMIAVRQKGSADSVLVFEDIYLLEAMSPEQGMSVAESLGKEFAALDDDLRVDDEPAERIFLASENCVQSTMRALTSINYRQVTRRN